MKRRFWLLGAVAVAGVGLAVAWVIARRAEVKTVAAFERGLSPIPYATTRGDIEDGELQPGTDPYTYRFEGEFPQGQREVTVIVHGLNNTDLKARNRFALARESMQRSGYPGNVIGFSWDGSTNWDPFGATGYRTAKHNAVATGRKLAQLVVDLRAKNPEARLRLVGYSMGALLVAEALFSLDQDSRFREVGRPVTSVYIVGAAIDNERLQVNERFGGAVERRCERFVNCHSPIDSKLAKYFVALEADLAVGQAGLEDRQQAPWNFRSIDVNAELLPVDKDGNIDPDGQIGRNHSAYLGIRNNRGEWLDDGAMDVIVRDMGFRRPVPSRSRAAGGGR